MKNSTKPTVLPWKIWLAWIPFAIALIAGFLLVEEKITKLPALHWLSLVIGLSPFIAAQLSFGSERAVKKLRNWFNTSSKSIVWTSGAISVLFILSGILIGQFDPYAAIIFSLGTFTALSALGEINKEKMGLTWTDGIVWILLWIPFDLRWNNHLWFGLDGFTYTWWSFSISVMAIIGWGSIRQFPGFGYRLTPRWKDILIGVLMIIPIFVLAVPIGLSTDFLRFSPSNSFQPFEIAAYFIGIFLTIAIPEELFSRAVLQNGLERLFKQHWIGWVLASMAFGLMHWNNASSLREKLIYCVLASIAGFFYGWAYKKSGNNILAPVITHTLVDLIWKVVFT